MERQRSAKPDCRVIRREMHAEVFDVHTCQSKLTAPGVSTETDTPGGPELRASEWARGSGQVRNAPAVCGSAENGLSRNLTRFDAYPTIPSGTAGEFQKGRGPEGRLGRRASHLPPLGRRGRVLRR